MEEEKPKRGRGRPRKNRRKEDFPDSPPPPPKKHQSQGLKKKIALIDETTKAYQVFDFLVQGYPLSEIANIMQVSKSAVIHTMTSALSEAYSETADLRNNWITVTFARLERVIFRLMDRINDDVLDTRFVDSLGRIIKLQGEVLGFGQPKLPTGNQQLGGQQFNIDKAQFFVPTVSASSKLYEQGLADEQKQITGSTMPQLEEATSNPRIRRLDGVLHGTIIQPEDSDGTGNP